jgi:hypothetical protein
MATKIATFVAYARGTARYELSGKIRLINTEILPTTYNGLQAKCPFLSISRNSIYMFWSACVVSAWYESSGKSLQWKLIGNQEGTLLFE